MEEIKFNPELESEGGKLYRQYCEQKGIDYSITAGANFCLGYMAVKPNQGAVWVKASSILIIQHTTYYAHWKDDQYDIKGSGFFNSGNEFIWDNSNLEEITKDKISELLILDESPAAGIKQINRDWICDMLIEFTIAYNKSANKDIANDAAEYLSDKLKDAGIEYILSEDESPAATGEEDVVESPSTNLPNKKIVLF